MCVCVCVCVCALGTFTLKSNQAEMLPPGFREFADFAALFPAADRLQCTKVDSTEEREWVRIVALRHDLQLWVPDARQLSTRFSIPYARQGWLPEVLELVPIVLLGALFLEIIDVSSANVVRGGGVWEGCVKEFVMSKSPPVALVFNIEEHGRRLYKRLVFSTDAARCFHHLPPMLQPSPSKSTQIGAWAVSAGDAAEGSSLTQKQWSLVIRRNLSGKLGPQTLIPARLLHGILPDALLDDYTFWLDEKDARLDEPSVLRGYKQPHAVARESGAPLDAIVIHCTPQGKGDPSGLGRSDAVGCVQRVLAVREGEGVCQEVLPVDAVGGGGGGASSLTLINSAFVDSASPVGRVLETMLRLENLSHILIWGSCASPGAVPTLQRVELPRLRLNFVVEAAKGGGDGGAADGVLLRSVEHDGLWVSNARSPELERLMQGMPHAIVLQDSAGDLYILASAAACPFMGEHALRTAKPGLFSCVLVLDRGNKEWLANLGQVRHYLYPVHISKRFLLLPSLASTLSLMLFKLLHRCYTDAGKLAASCMSDTTFSSEEAQIWDRLALTTRDVHPDSIGVRLLISCATSASKCAVPWSVEAELASYCRLADKIHETCRLNVQQELMLLQQYGQTTPHTRDRCAMLSRISSSVPGSVVQVKIEQSQNRRGHRFDEIDDRTCLSGSAGGAGLAEYKPPEQGYGSKTVSHLNSIVGQLTLRGKGKQTPGFLLCIELLNGSLDLRILETDQPRILGALLLRILPESESHSYGLLMSILRVAASNPNIASGLPSFWARWCEAKLSAAEDKKSSLLGGLFSSGGFEASKVNSDFIKTVCSLLQTERDRLKWPVRHDDFNSDGELSFACPAHEVRLHQGLWSLDVSDFSCSARDFRGDPHLLALQLPSMLLAFVELSDKQGRESDAFGARFPVDKHPAVRSSNVLRRLEGDTIVYNNKIRQKKLLGGPLLRGFSDTEISTALSQAWPNPSLAKLQAAATDLYASVLDQQQRDLAEATKVLALSLALADSTEKEGIFALKHALAQIAGRTQTASIENLASLFMTPMLVEQLQLMNPVLSPQDALNVETQLATALLLFCRAGHLSRICGLVEQLLSLLQRKDSDIQTAMIAVQLKAKAVAQGLSTTRALGDGHVNSYDPRLLVFEFNGNLILRPSQVKLVGKFVAAYKEGRSLCHQLIMGAGKTTVIGPLLVLMLASTETAVLQVVPSALLEMTRSILRERFSALVQKQVYTFTFDRASRIDEELLHKLEHARASRAIIVASPTSLKSFVLKFAEMIHQVDERSTAERTAANVGASEGRGLLDYLGLRTHAQSMANDAQSADDAQSAQNIASFKSQAAVFPKIMSLFQSGVLLLDEVDLLLHPLKSELNWPMGVKTALDLSLPSSSSSVAGMRWLLPLHVLDALFFVSSGKTTRDLSDSASAERILGDLRTAVMQGVSDLAVQVVPHLVVLDVNFYHVSLKPLFAQWALTFLSDKGFAFISNDQLLDYILEGARAGDETVAAVRQHCKDDNMKLLNLAHDWIISVLPHVLGKVNRVSYGLLDDAMLQCKDTLSRKLLSVPFVGKDVPSPASEFSHPEVLIGFSVLSYRYEGLRLADWRILIHQLLQQLSQEVGPTSLRPSSLRWKQWVELAGGQVRGSKSLRSKSQEASSALATSSSSVSMICMYVCTCTGTGRMTN